MSKRNRLTKYANAAPSVQRRLCRQICPPPDNRFQSVALLLLGALLGALAMLFLAPKSGKATRRRLKEQAGNLAGKLKTKRPAATQKSGLSRISNWGNYPQTEVKVYEFEDIATLRKIVTGTNNIIARGNGRCYGDSALAANVISSLKYNKFLSFDAQQGIIRCQAGVLLSELLDVVVPQGWFLPVTPGTKKITVGGAIASDVHGKSQHKAGNFSDHVVAFDLMLGDGSVVTCSKEENPELYWTTCGGMGLTGVVLHATLRLLPVETAYFKQESIKAKNLQELMDLFEESESWPYSVAWIDCMTRGKNMGRGILMRGRHARVSDLEKPAQRQNPLRLKSKMGLNVPFFMPGFVLNPLSMKIFNTLYFHRQRARQVTSVVDYNAFFYPLDIISNWNRIYGKRGFTQYQFILPKESSRQGMQEILQKIVDRGMVSFLAVLKLYGKQHGYLPFAMEGYSLALDFPIVDGLFEFLDELDQIVLAYGGRLYLTKDVRMGRDMFMQSYPNAEKFINHLKQINQNFKFRSYQSDRIGITQ
ncbi:MAG: FAD-binding protein [Chloroflexi bacterium]|nr:MAG: FAD-binding protein [Chloroflexota bacterium]